MHSGRLLAVDPGIRHCGTALFYQGELERCGLVKNVCPTGNGPHECCAMARAVYAWTGGLSPQDLILEWPQVYGQGKWKGDPNDLLPLAGVDSALCSLFSQSTVQAPRPAKWKGQVPKDVMSERILSRLSVDEREIVEGCLAPKALRHNVVDAVGLGLWWLGRLEKVRAT